MKKWIIGLLALVLIATACIYIFIPTELHISQVTILRSSKNASYRFLSEESNWKKWWPSDSPNKKDSFNYNGYQYQLLPKLTTDVDVLIRHDNLDLKSTINITPLVRDSIAIQWRCTMVSGSNPVSRIFRYNEATRVKKNMADILEHFQTFMQNLDNVYGIHIDQTSTKDTLLICTKSQTSRYPTTADTYELINKLRKFIDVHGARQTGIPMRNITMMDSGVYQMMVAIPIDKFLEKKNEFFPNRLIPGQFLVAEVKGGQNSIDEAQRQIRLYMEEYKRLSMAIPFESLITDRSIQPDTTKWVTKLFNPVF